MTKAYSYIRMSTDAQLKGDSLRRQIEKTRQFAHEQGLVLDEAFELKDIGLSAFDGTNVEKGELGKFLQAVRSGQVEKGSYLIVESLDRLSRQRVNQSLRMLLDLLDAGINVATLIDRRTYTPHSSDPFELMMSVALMARANDESLHKSDRVRAAWGSKRKNASQKIMTAKSKGWLKPKADRTGFDPIPDRIEVVKRIFSEAADQGIGTNSITRRLNRDRIPSFGGPGGWYKSYVLRILTDRSVLGEFQPHVTVKGKRQPTGEPIFGYFPAIIDEALFYRAQAALAKRRLAGGGNKGPRVSNLFSKVARCGLCGSRMTFVNKGGPNGTSLVCNSARRGLGCYRTGWNYPDFERTFLTFMRELDLSAISQDTHVSGQLETCRARKAELDGRLAIAVQQRSRLLSVLLGDEPTDFLKAKLREQDQAVAELEAELVTVSAAADVLHKEAQAYADNAENVAALIDQLQASASDETYRARSMIAARLQDLVSEILVWPTGAPVNPVSAETIRAMVLEKYPDGTHDPNQYTSAMGKDLRALWVRFKDGTFKFVAPSASSRAQHRLFVESGADLSFGQTTIP